MWRRGLLHHAWKHFKNLSVLSSPCGFVETIVWTFAFNTSPVATWSMTQPFILERSVLFNSFESTIMISFDFSTFYHFMTLRQNAQLLMDQPLIYRPCYFIIITLHCWIFQFVKNRNKSLRSLFSIKDRMTLKKYFRHLRFP